MSYFPQFLLAKQLSKQHLNQDVGGVIAGFLARFPKPVPLGRQLIELMRGQLRARGQWAREDPELFGRPEYLIACLWKRNGTVSLWVSRDDTVSRSYEFPEAQIRALGIRPSYSLQYFLLVVW